MAFKGRLIIETLVVDALKGQKGDQGTPGINGVSAMDYSILSEQVATGEFFLSRTGVRTQVYTRTWVIEAPYKQTSFGVYTLMISINIASNTILDVKGFYIDDINQNVIQPMLHKLTTIESNIIQPDITLYETGSEYSLTICWTIKDGCDWKDYKMHPCS